MPCSGASASAPASPAAQTCMCELYMSCVQHASMQLPHLTHASRPASASVLQYSSLLRRLLCKCWLWAGLNVCARVSVALACSVAGCRWYLVASRSGSIVYFDGWLPACCAGAEFWSQHREALPGSTSLWGRAAAASTQAAKWLTSFNEGFGVPAHALRAKICLCCTRRRVPGNKALVFLHLSWPGSLRIANHL